ncbi:sigma factor-like helix-turn-helix DNA-binding protein [Niallia sp. 03133]|uniref:sigma factor-like helix-turn-helix DNA-binding protein n=1 Tax=Niallia sp. 03133 TaxID=3458060 RepID=UPI004044E3B8
MKIKNLSENDRILNDFFADLDNKNLYERHLEKPTEDIKNTLDKRFKKHIYITRCVAYLIKAIYFYSQRFDKNLRENSHRFPLVLDKPMEDGNSMTEMIPSPFRITEYYTQLEDYLSDPNLHKSLQLLTTRQKQILYLIYIKELRDYEVAAILNISQQAVTKSKNKAINKLKEGFYFGRDR